MAERSSVVAITAAVAIQTWNVTSRKVAVNIRTVLLSMVGKNSKEHEIFAVDSTAADWNSKSNCKGKIKNKFIESEVEY